MRRYLLLLAALLFSSPAISSAQDAVAEKPVASKHSGEDFLRLAKDPENENELIAMQTAIVRYHGKSGTPYEGQTVDLVGVVHIAEADYYQELDKRLGEYDVVLYELVAPDGTKIRPEDLQDRRSILGAMQSGMKSMLNLEYQLEKIDYLRDNFRHADMSPEEFAQDMERRGDNILKMVARMMGAGLASSATGQGGGNNDISLLMALISGNRSKMMKQTMARQLIQMEAITAGMDDEQGENTLIKGRNAKAFKILREELDQGEKRVAVFYGAGHLIDMAERLESEFGMVQGETVWLDAWDLTTN